MSDGLTRRGGESCMEPCTLVDSRTRCCLSVADILPLNSASWLAAQYPLLAFACEPRLTRGGPYASNGTWNLWRRCLVNSAILDDPGLAGRPCSSANHWRVG